MSKTTTLSMRVPARDDTHNPDLPTKIRQIIQQKGAFRHVNEQALALEETSADNVQDSEPVDGDEELSAFEIEETPQARLEKLWKGREEMLRNLDRAQNDVLTALDFLSLLLSKQSVPAQGSMSPALKQSVPVGCLDARVVQPGALSTASKKRLVKTSQGWRCQAFDSALGKLSRASSTLHSEAERESKFWEQVADLRQQGWAVSRHPRDAKAIGVHFGFAECAPQFRQRGFALLRQDENGNVYLDQTATPNRRMAVQVHILRKGTVTGFHVQFAASSNLNNPASQQVLDARNALFEEELFYEISREARSIANYGVLTRAQAVQFEVQGEYQVKFAIQDVSDDFRLASDDQPDGKLAQLIGLSVRSNLLKAHEANRIRRSQAPGPMSSRASFIPEYVLLRPIIATLRQQTAVKELLRKVELLILPIARAGEQTTLKLEEQPKTLSKSSSDQPDQQASNFAGPTRTVLHLDLPSKRVFEVTVSSLLAAPIYGTHFQTCEVDYGFIRLQAATYDNLQSTMSALCRVLSLDLVSTVLAVHSPPMPAASLALKLWQVSQPLNGELVLLQSGQLLGRLRISVDLSGLILKLVLFSDSEKARKIGLLWTEDGLSAIGAVGDVVNDSGSQPSFSHVIAQVSKLGDQPSPM